MGKKEVRTRSPHHDDRDSQEESETRAMSCTSSEKRRLDITGGRASGGWPPEAALRMAARKFGSEEHDRDDGDCMAQIQELQELLAEQAACSRSPPTGAVRQLAASRVVFDDIMVFDLEAQLASHDGL